LCKTANKSRKTLNLAITLEKVDYLMDKAMQNRNTRINDSTMDEYLRRGRLERSIAMRTFLRAGVRAFTRGLRAFTRKESSGAAVDGEPTSA
jgi:hypothetical protein